VKRIGRAVAESAADPDQLGDYYNSALEAMQRLRRLFHPYLAPMDKLRLILNRANSKVRLDASEVERTLGVKAEALIPSDIVVPQAVNRGEPVVYSAPRSPVTKAFEDLADEFIPVHTKKRRK
jgi:Flp pilus assembly CpaE family ATPase